MTTAADRPMWAPGAFPMQRRNELFEELLPLVTSCDEHPCARAKL
jgi:hypothetical protein